MLTLFLAPVCFFFSELSILFKAGPEKSKGTTTSKEQCSKRLYKRSTAFKMKSRLPWVKIQTKHDSQNSASLCN